MKNTLKVAAIALMLAGIATIAQASQPRYIGQTYWVDVVDGGRYYSSNQPVPVSMPNDAGAQFEMVLHGTETMSSGSVAVTFVPAFAVRPDCTCSHLNTTPIQCGFAEPSTTTITLKVPLGASDKVSWICAGTR